MHHEANAYGFFVTLAAVLAPPWSTIALAACPATSTTNPDEAFGRATIVFAGVVESVSNMDRFATVKIEEVFKGPSLASTVEVHAGPGDPTLNTSNDRSFEVNTRYFFFPENDRSPFQDSTCTATCQSTPDLEARLRELGEPSKPHTLPRTGISVPIVTMLLIAGSVFGMGGLILRSCHQKKSV